MRRKLWLALILFSVSQGWAVDVNLPIVTITAVTPNALESGTLGAYQIVRSNVGSSDLQVYFKMAGTAIPDDYGMNVQGFVVIPAGETSVIVDFRAVNDTVIENNETAVMKLVSKPTYVLGSPALASINIISDDVPLETTVTISVIDGDASETPGQTGLLRISRTGPTTTSRGISLVQEGTAKAAWGEDYTTMPSGVSFNIPAGASYIDLHVNPTNDSVKESDEKATIRLTYCWAGCVIGLKSSASVLIHDND